MNKTEVDRFENAFMTFNVATTHDQFFFKFHFRTDPNLTVSLNSTSLFTLIVCVLLRFG